MDDEIYGLRAAAAYAGVTNIAIRNWCRKHDIGHKIDGVWIINRAKLDAVTSARGFLKLRERV